MRGFSLTYCAAIALIAGALACAGNRETGAAVVENRDTTGVADTTQNPPGYRGIERDTTMVPPQTQQPVDTFLQHQGDNPRADTNGYNGVERVDTTHARVTDTTGRDTTRVWNDTTSRDTTRSDTTRSDTTSVNRPDTTSVQPQP